MGGIVKRVSAEIGEDTCLLGFSGRDYIKSASFQASTLSSKGEGGVDEVQSVAITGAPTGGTFTLSFKGAASANIPFNATVAVVEDLLEAVSTVGDGNVRVTGSTGGPYAIHFQNDLGHAGQPLITKNAAGLTGGTSPNVTVTRTTAGSDLTSPVAPAAGWDPRIVVGSPDFPGTIVTKVASADGGTLDKVKEYTGAGGETIFGVIDGEEEFMAASPAADRDVAVYVGRCDFDASKIKNYSTFKTAFDAWAAAHFCSVQNG